jgi:sugar fermentation stimulation protein A
MRFATPLIRATLLKRYKRFLADVILETGESVTAACPNTGAMLGLTEPGSTVFLSRSESPTRKYPHSWEMIDVAGIGLVGVNTGNPNRIAAEAIREGFIPDLAGYGSLRHEVKYGLNSRIDILLEDKDRPPCYVEVKNAHLFRAEGLCEFPDCPTARGTRHLEELARVARRGGRAVMLYLIQAGHPTRFALAPDLDPTYFKAFKRARKAGVEAFALSCHVTPEAITAHRLVPVEEP